MEDKLVKLIDLKSIITAIVIVAMVIFTALGIIGPELFITTCGAVVTYFFTKKKEEQTYMEPEPITTNTIGFQQPDKESE